MRQKVRRNVGIDTTLTDLYQQKEQQIHAISVVACLFVLSHTPILYSLNTGDLVTVQNALTECEAAHV